MTKRPMLILAVALLGGAAWMAWQARGPVVPPQPPGAPLISQAAADRVARDLPLAVAYLENHETAEAIELLTAMEADFPDDKAVRQNLAIARVMAAHHGSAGNTPAEIADKAARRAAAEKEIAQLIKVRPDDWHSFAIAGLYYERLGEYEAAFQQFQVIAPITTSTNGGASRPATRIGDETMLYAVWKSGKVTRNDEIKAIARQAIARAAEVAPENLWILLELTFDQLEREDAGLIQTCDRFLPLVPVIFDSVLRNTKIDLAKALTEIKALAEQARGETDPQAAKAIWRKATLIGRPACNVSRSEDAAQTDQKYMERHVLDFTVSELPASVEKRADAATTPQAAEIALEWATAPLPAGLDVGAVITARLADLTLDRQPELCVLTSDKFVAWSRTAEGQWSEVLQVPAGGVQGFVLIDLDDDAKFILADTPANKDAIKRADLDIVLYGEAGVQLVENKLEGETRSLVPWPADRAEAQGNKVRLVEAADLDLDGDMDLLVAGEAGLRFGFNSGQPKFFTRSDTPALVPAGVHVTRIVTGDFDRDLDIDALAVADGKVVLLDGVRHAVLRWKALPELDALKGITDLAVLDADQNASWDLLLATDGGPQLALTRTVMAGKWTFDAGRISSVGSPSVDRIQLADLDNDGTEDLIGSGSRLWRGVGQKFVASTHWTRPPDSQTKAAATASDLDGDGDLDLCWSGPGELALWTNGGGHQNSWIDLEIVGVQTGNDNQKVASGRVNHYGAGGLLELRGPSGFQARIIRSENPHFGLGPAGQADLARLIWPNGYPYNVFNPQSNETLWEVQTLLGSCPYLYAWDGEKFVFVTDLLWAAPLGMPSPNGGLTPSRDWEYLKVPGSLVQARDGKYRFQLTEELYEAAYFDQVDLVAIDHPTDVAVYSNEKVGPPMIAERMLHTVRTPQTPLSARDQAGRDLLPQIQSEDEIYTQHWDQKFKQGWTEKTTLELDLGPQPDPARITLFMTGWVYPTDPSISVALQQDPSRAGFGIQPPALEIPDGQGGWTVADPYIGFPGGKTKTIAIDLTGKLRPGDGRLRIVTSMELHWDRIFFTVDEPSAEVHEFPLKLLSADLHFRGCSARVRHPQFGPERYDYAQVGPQFYPAMDGHFTRYGTVTDLLTERDDRMVVLGCGDECTLEFEALPPPPNGWTRDFLLHNVGWDKDCNPQNIYARTVEPLPHAGMQSYPPEVPFPDDARHRDYLETYQTRTQSDVNFRRFTLRARR